ncbi:SMAD/FHA domain-containing protein [Xylariomycetidae sp. FL2044]|nr:SMAD/FHA domain-containing protein [Xylariomycetidae sp. FL2044]
MEPDAPSPIRQPRRHYDDRTYDRDRRSQKPYREHVATDDRYEYSRDGGNTRHRSRERSRERRHQRRSRSPEPTSRRRSRSRDRDRGRDRDQDGKRNKDREHRRKRSRDHGKHSDRESHRRRAREDNDKDHQGHESGSKQVPTSFAITKGEEPVKPKEKPNYGNSGALAAASNSIVQADGSTIVLKYHEPPEARKPSPKDQWKLFVFKGDEIVDTVPLSSRSCWLIGRDLAIVDMAAEHPSISKQHAVIQFRYIEKRNEYGDKLGKVKPYLIDLESANGTMLNSEKVPESRYLELRDKDMLQFGQSTREYVVMLAPKD